MFVKGRVKPSKGSSLLGMIVGVGFVIFGLTTILPSAPIFFGILWIAATAGITIFNGINFFSDRGVSQWEVDVESGPARESARDDVEARLRRLERLKRDRLITDEEYQEKRSEILNEKW